MTIGNPHFSNESTNTEKINIQEEANKILQIYNILEKRGVATELFWIPDNVPMGSIQGNKLKHMGIGRLLEKEDRGKSHKDIDNISLEQFQELGNAVGWTMSNSQNHFYPPR